MASVFGAGKIHRLSDVDIPVFTGIIGLVCAAREREAVDRLDVDQRSVTFLDSFCGIPFPGKHTADRAIRHGVGFCGLQHGDGIPDVHNIAHAHAHILNQPAVRRGDHVRIACRHLSGERSLAQGAGRYGQRQRQRC